MFDVLAADEPAERERWIAFWERWPDREPAGHPAYAELFRARAERVVCVVAGSPDAPGAAYALVPLVVRPVATEAWGAGERAVDLASPYGYGGPFGAAPDEGWAREFWGRFQEWARAVDAVTVFLRLSLFESQLLPRPWPDVVRSSNVVRDLTPEPEAIWRDYDKKVRKNVRRATEHAVEVSIESGEADRQVFLDIYRSTMERRGASAFYRLDDGALTVLIDELPVDTRQLAAARSAGGEPLASELVLASRRYTYSFLGGASPGGMAVRAPDLLKHEIIGWSRSTGREAFVLGGGKTPDDGIFQFKRAFAPSGSMPFRTCDAVLDADAYAGLVAERREFERRAGRDWEPARGYFPAYRS